MASDLDWKLGDIAQALQLNAVAIVVHADKNFQGQKEIAAALKQNAQAINTLCVIVAKTLNQDYESAFREAARVTALVDQENRNKEARMLEEKRRRENSFRYFGV